MLNRLFIVIGVLAIIAIAAAFIAPRFIQWSDYRDRMELIAGDVFGTQVEILGDIEFSLLPAPQMQLADVVVGPPESPLISVGAVEAEFSLLDFLRDRYSANRLVLNRPVFDAHFDENGLLSLPLALPETVNAANVSIRDARIENGAIRIADDRSGAAFSFTNVDGDLRLQSLRGPFTFQGQTEFGNTGFSLRVATSTIDADGSTRLTASLAPHNDAFSIDTEGVLMLGGSPHYEGELTYRQTPPQAEDAANVQGDLVLTSAVNANPDQILLPAFSLQPDENRAGTRLTGNAVVHLGTRQDFDAAVTGGVVTLPPRDATQEAEVSPYEIVRILAELPPAPVATIPGRVRLEIAEFNLRAFSLRDVSLEATTDGTHWTLESFTSRLPGDTTLTVAGELESSEARPRFSGRAIVEAGRLDALAQMWRKPLEENPLFNRSGRLEADVALAGDDLTLSDGKALLGNVEHGFSLRIGFGPERDLEIGAQLANLDEENSRALAALLPDPSQDPSFPLTFSQGRFDVTAQSATVMGLDGRQLAAKGIWIGDEVTLDSLSAVDLGGLGFALSGAVQGTLADPQLSAKGSVQLAEPGAPALDLIYDRLSAPDYLRDFLGRMLPASLDVALEEPDPTGGQLLTATGTLGVADLGLSAQFSGGLDQALTAPLALTAQLASADVIGLSRQFGLGDTPIFPEREPVRLKLVLEGSSTEQFATNLVAEGSGDSITFEGTLSARDIGAPVGIGHVEAKLSDFSGLASVMGAEGLTVPGATATASMRFEGARSLALSGIAGEAGGDRFSGELRLEREGPTGVVSGSLAVGEMDVRTMARLLAGPAATTELTETLWPDGPLMVGEAARTTRGVINITGSSVTSGTRTLMRQPSFELLWDASNIRMRGLQGEIGGGRLTLDAGICCAGANPQKQLSGRITLENVDLDAVLPPSAAAEVNGIVSSGLQVNGTGTTLAEMAAAMTGDGNFTLSELSVEKLDPAAFQSIDRVENVLDLESEALTNIVALALESGPFLVDELSGAFTIAGGVARVANVAADGEDGSLFGGLELRLADLDLNGEFILSPEGDFAEGSLVDADIARVATLLSGTLLEPQRNFDLAPLVDTVQARALETELDRLEQLRAEDESRRRAAAEERARQIAAEQQRRAQEEAERLAAEQPAEPPAQTGEGAAAQQPPAAQPAAQPIGPPQAAPVSPIRPGLPSPFQLQPPQTF